MPSEFMQRQIDGLLEEAAAAVRALDWKTVRDRAQAALGLDPDNGDARGLLEAAQRNTHSGDGSEQAPAGSVPRVQPAPSAPLLPTSFASGRYNVRSFLGEGAKKRVYLAHDTKLDRDVAFALIKTDGLDADGIVRVRREAQAMGRLGDNAHIVTIHDTGDENGAPFIVSQLMAGGSVEDLLAKADQHRIAPDRARKIAEQVCAALAHAHGRGIIHRDLKPGNVWLDAEGNAALGDFGLAMAIDRSRMTMQGMMVGTVAYMPPEQALGRTPDARSDLYALGAMLYEMVTGRPPFLGDDAVGVISQHINTPPIDPSWHNPECPKPLEALILRLLAKSPDERPASAQEVAQELRRILDRSTVDTVHPQTPDAASDLRGINWGFFVGRREEMDGLKEALENSLSGKGSLAMLVGEPGIGKTRLAEEFGVYSGLRGAQVLTGHCYEGEASLPYRPFIEALRQYTRSRPDDELRTQLGPGAPEIATLVSEIRVRFPDVEEAPKLDGEAERLRLFESVTEFLHNASTAQPLVLHLDDLHWADKPSLLLLQHLAQRTARDRLLILGAYRDVELERTHPLAEALGALRRLPNYRRVLLRGLPLDSVASLLGVIEPSEEAAAGRQALAAALHQETEGNPFFIREVLAHLVETGKIAHEHGRWVGKVNASEFGIPEGVREVIGRRLTRLSDACNRMLTVASTMSGGFSWQVLMAINADVLEADLLDLLEEALAAQLIAERKGELSDTYDFTHALIRQTLYGELSGPRRVLLHRQIGEALERLYAANVEPHLAVLAHHFYQAAPGGDVEKAIDYAKRAGDRAMTMTAWEEAAEHYKRALQAFELQVTPDQSRRCRLLLALGMTHWRSGSAIEAHAVFGQAVELARALRAADLFASAALGVGMGTEVGTVNETVVSLLEESLELLGQSDGTMRARVLAALAGAVYWSGAAARRASLIEEAVEVARRIGDKTALADVLGAKHQVLADPSNIEERLIVTAEILELAREAGDQRLALMGHSLRHDDFLELGDTQAAELEMQAHGRLATTLREFVPQWLARVRLAMRAILEGRFAEAERLAQEALAQGQAILGQNALQTFGIQLSRVRGEQGRLGELEVMIRGFADRYPAIPGWRARLASIYSELRQEEEARREFERMAAHDFADIPRDGAWLVAVMYLAETAAFLGDARRGEILYELLLPYARLNIVVGGAACNGSASRYLGPLAATMGRWSDAERHFEDAVAMNSRMGSPPLVARTQLQYAEMLLARDTAGDKTKALGLLQRSLNTAQELGMTKLTERGLALKLEAQGATASGLYTSIDAVTRAVSAERPEVPQQAVAPDGTVTIMFSDIEDSTVLTERLGDQAWLELLREHNALIRKELRAYDGFEVKTIGDCFMVAFQSAKKGLDCAIAIQRAFDGQNAAAGEHVKVRIGLHAGEAIKDGDDFYGKNVILASRVAGKAVGGEILVSSLLRQLVESSIGAGTFSEPRELELKGLAGTHTVFAVAST